MPAAGLGLSALVLAAGNVDVRSDTDCPRSEAIAERLQPVLPSGVDPSAASGVAWITSVPAQAGEPAAVRLRLLRADGYVIGDRRLALRDDCTERAETIAAVIATWETAPMLATPPGLLPSPATRVDAPATSLHARPSRTVMLALGVGVGAATVGGIAAQGQMDAPLVDSVSVQVLSSTEPTNIDNFCLTRLTFNP